MRVPRRFRPYILLLTLASSGLLLIACVGGSTPGEDTPAPEGREETAATTSQVLAEELLRYIAADPSEGVPLLSTCSEDAETGSRWENGVRVQVFRSGVGACSGWSLVRSGVTESWVLDDHLASTDPLAGRDSAASPEPVAASATGSAVATPTSAPRSATPASTPRATASATATPTATEEACNFEDSADLVGRSTVQALTDSSWGTAFYVGGGEFVTAAHVVADVSEARLLSSTVDVIAQVVGTDPLRDIAILRAVVGVPALAWGDASDTASGETVGAVGYPVFSSNVPSVVRGVFSRIFTFGSVDTVQTDAALNPGNSGGPLFDICGAVLGVVSFGFPPNEGFSFAIAEHAARSGMVTARANPQPENVTTVTTLEDWLALLDAIDFDTVDAFGVFVDSDGTDDDFADAAATFQLLFDESKALQAEIRAENYTADGEACEAARAMLEEAAKQLSLSLTNLRDAFALTNFDPDRTFDTLIQQISESRLWRDLAEEQIAFC